MLIPPPVYDHPLVRLSNRQSVLTHFALLQLLSRVYLPSITPSSILLHARGLTSRVRGALLGSDEVATAEVTETKRVVDPLDEWLESSGGPSVEGALVQRDSRGNGWWKLWDVSAECRDIGCMECYGGFGGLVPS